MLNSMAGYDDKDSTSSRKEVPDFAAFIGQGIKGLKIGIPDEYRPDGLSAEVAGYWDKAAEILKAAGAEIVRISLPHTQYALPAYYVIAPAEASSNLARYDGVRYGLRVDGNGLDELYINTRTEGFGKEVKRRILIGTYVLSAGYYDAYYLKAQKVRRLIKNDFDEAFQKCDIILTPTSPVEPFAIGDKSMMENPINMYLNDVFTVSVNLAGLPALSLPIGLSSHGLPLGMQLIGRAFDEGTIFKTAYQLERGANLLGYKICQNTLLKRKRKWEIICGLEIHCQIISKSKIFSGASTEFGDDVNENVSFVDAGMPGMLPTLNTECVHQAIKTGLGLNAVINKYSEFPAKLFYADLPKGTRLRSFISDCRRRLY